MDAPLVQCVPNFSEGRDAAVVEAIAGAIRAAAGVRLADYSADPDHHRMVATFVGPPEPVLEAALAAAAVAIERIDLRRHVGAHPRLGALDVLPFVPLRSIGMEACAELARRAAQRLATEFGVPVFLYDAAAPDGRSLPQVRKGAFRTLAPDYGPAAPHPSAGAVVCGARGPLIAFNVNLKSFDLAAAQRIARDARATYAGRVRALGLALASRGVVQVSMNIIRPDAVALPELIAFIAARADVAGCELIGAMPGFTAFDAVRSALILPGLRPGQVLFETWPDERADGAGGGKETL